MASSGLLLAGALVLVTALPTEAAWMTYVARDVATGERLGRGAAVYSGDGLYPKLSIQCTTAGMSALFDTGVAIPESRALADYTAGLMVAADDEPYDAFPVTAESFRNGEANQLRLRLSATEAAFLLDYVLAATETIQVSYRQGEEQVAFAIYPIDSAAMTLGAVLEECKGNSKR